MKQNRSFLQKAVAFAEDKGFYIILALCAVAIGISGYVLFFTGSSADDIPEPQVPVSGQEEVKLPSGETPDTQPQDDADEPAAPDTPDEPDIPETPETPEEPEDPPAQETNNPVNVPVEQPVYTLPVSGDVIRGHSGQALEYDETMADWRVHGGTDFSCTEGEQVLAIMDGEVSAVYTDEMWGNCVSIQHADGLVSTYCGLMKNATMKEGMSVKSGDVIGGAGGGIACESAQPMHIHLIVTQNGESIDPMTLFE